VQHLSYFLGASSRVISQRTTQHLSGLFYRVKLLTVRLLSFVFAVEVSDQSYTAVSAGMYTRRHEEFKLWHVEKK